MRMGRHEYYLFLQRLASRQKKIKVFYFQYVVFLFYVEDEFFSPKTIQCCIAMEVFYALQGETALSLYASIRAEVIFSTYWAGAWDGTVLVSFWRKLG